MMNSRVYWMLVCVFIGASTVYGDGQCTVSNCGTCNNAALMCKECYIGTPENITYRGAIRLTVPKSGKCTDYNIANCTQYEMLDGNPTSKCKACLEGYVLSDDKSSCLNCSANNVFANCAVCDGTSGSYTCSSCKPGYVFKDNACSQCPANCARCSVGQSGSILCDECEQSYGLKSDKTQCVECMYTVNDQGGTYTRYCPSCSLDVSGNFDKCTACDSGFLLNDGTCSSGCSPLSQRCYRCEDSNGDGTADKCLECDEFYALSNGDCSACSIQDTSTECYGCSADDLTKCGECYPHAWKRREFWVVKPNGSGCTKCMDKCETCIDSNNDGTPESCTNCVNGTRYNLKDGVCQDCSDTQCAQCSEEVTCATCNSGYTLSNNGLTCTSGSGSVGSSTVPGDSSKNPTAPVGTSDNTTAPGGSGNDSSTPGSNAPSLLNLKWPVTIAILMLALTFRSL